MASAESNVSEEPRHPATSAGALLDRRGVRMDRRSVRSWAARGVIINSAFSIGTAALALVRGLLIARFLMRADYGVWGIVIASVSTLSLLKQLGIGDKFVQQEADDQELAFQQAFTLEAILNGLATIALIGAAPLIALAYGRHQLLLPLLLMTLVIPARALSAPSWALTRQMRWAAQRWLSAIDPVVGTALALALAAAGAGYWSLVVGFLVGGWAGSLAMVIASPYRLRLRFDRAQARSYFAFSWPLFVVNGSVLVMAQSAYFFGNDALGLAGAGAIALSATISQFSTQVDAVVSGTMYPVVCAVQRRVDLLYESFVKSNRVALMWAVPFGIGLALFASDLVRFGIGQRWRPAIPLLEVFGVFAAIGHFGFNWDDYFRARGDTRPIAWTAVITLVSFLVTMIPLVYISGIKGLAAAVAIQTVVSIGCRVYFLRRLFDGFDMLRHAARACAPVIPGLVCVLLLRLVEPRSRHLGEVFLELALFAAITIAATWLLERRLLAEMIGYLRGSSRLRTVSG